MTDTGTVHRYGSEDSYTGHDVTTGLDHFVPEGWEQADRGICPRCGLTVTWNAGREKWEPAPLVVLVLTQDEYKAIRSTCPERLEPWLDLMSALTEFDREWTG